MTTTRGTTNRDARGSTEDRCRRRACLVGTYRADTDAQHTEVRAALVAQVLRVRVDPVPASDGMPACRCYRCGLLLTVDTDTVDRIIPDATAVPAAATKIRPAGGSNISETGGALASRPKRRTKR